MKHFKLIASMAMILTMAFSLTAFATDTGSLRCTRIPTDPCDKVEKTEYPSIEKTVDDNTVNIGQVVTYTISGKVPNTTGFSSYTYKVTDKMSRGLTFNQKVADFTVKIGDEKIEATPVYADNGFVLSINMKNYQDKIGEDVTVTYSAVVNSNAVIGVAGNPNNAVLTYSNNPKNACSTETTPPEVVKVYTAALQIVKFDGNNKCIKLEGARFVLKNSDGKYYSFADATADSPESVKWVDSQEDATVVTTGTDGKAFFRGIESGSYDLVEIEAPKGYNILNNPLTVTINHEKQSEKVYQLAEVENNKGPHIPETGDTGVVMLYVIGLLLVTVSAGILLFRRKMRGV